MAEEAAPQTPPEPEPAAAADENGPEEEEVQDGGRVNWRLTALIGALLLLAGTFIGSRLNRVLPVAAGPDTPGAPGPDGGGPTTQPRLPFTDPAAFAGEMPPYVYYLNVCDGIQRTPMNHLNLFGVKAHLRPPTLPSRGDLTVVATVSSPSRERQMRIRGIAPGGEVFLDAALKLDPTDPTLPSANMFTIKALELTSPEPLLIMVFADEAMIIHRFVPVRPRDREPTTGPTTGPTTAPATAPDGEPAGEPGGGAASEEPAPPIAPEGTRRGEAPPQ